MNPMGRSYYDVTPGEDGPEITQVPMRNLRRPGSVERLLRRVQYKPGWSFEWVPDSDRYGYGPGRLKVTMQVLDSRWAGHGEHPTIPVTAYIPVFEEKFDHMDDRELIEWFKRAIIWHIERHEIDEWFKVDGKLVHDPHA